MDAIESIESLMKSTTAERIAGTRHQRMILERELEIICEASRKVPLEVKAHETAIEWQRMIDLGNRLRHGYDTIRLNILLQIVHDDLPPLKSFVERVLAQEGKR